MKSLSVKYRPQTFDDVVGQDTVIKILKKQIELNQYTNCYLFCGYSGIGKTTIARIFANEINKGIGDPIEIDGASNNGVENVRKIIDSAKERSVSSEYKIFIIDEAHQITNAAWNAFLKCIEEPPKYTIFMFCTTDPQKIPTTILNRLMRFNLLRIKTNIITERLKYICNLENINDTGMFCEYIAKISNGSLRTAISYLETCSYVSNNLDEQVINESLGLIDQQIMFDITNDVVSQDRKKLLSDLSILRNNNVNITKFLDSYIRFIIDLSKYIVLQDVSVLSISASFSNDIAYVTNVFGDKEKDLCFFNDLAESLLKLRYTIKDELSMYDGIELLLMKATK